MPACLYCRAPTDGTEPPDHPVLQALGTSDTLPLGDVCRSCNSYLSDLDHHFCNHPHIAALIVFGQIRGTKRRIRASVSPGLTFDTNRQHLRVKGGTGRLEDGTLTVSHPGPPDFQPWKFSRALHRIGLGVVGKIQGAAVALDARFDGVRSYVRQPANRAVRGYFQRPTDKLLGNRTMPAAVAQRGHYLFQITTGPAAVFVYANFFVTEFVFALDGTIESLSQDDLGRIAGSTGLPATELSSRTWIRQPTNKILGTDEIRAIFDAAPTSVSPRHNGEASQGLPDEDLGSKQKR